MTIDEKKLAALAKKNAAKVAKEKAKVRRKYDDTLPKEDEDPETRRLFKEMKKREF